MGQPLPPPLLRSFSHTILTSGGSIDALARVYAAAFAAEVTGGLMSRQEVAEKAVRDFVTLLHSEVE